MAALSFVLTAILLSVTHKGAKAAQLTINPPSLTLTGNSTSIVRFTCTPGMNVSPQDLLYSLTISRVATGSTPDSIPLGSASQKYSNDGAARMDTTTLPGATIEGSLSQQSITITYAQASCKDEATFACTAAVFSSSQAAYPTPANDTKNFTVDVSVGAVSMTQEPLLSTYLVNTTLIMRCNGLVGSNEPGTKIEWVWQYKDSGAFMFSDYSGTEDISQDTILPDGNSCQYRQTSTLTRQITMDDNRREYQCFVRRNGIPTDPDSRHLATYLLGAVYENQPTNPGTGSQTDAAAPAKANIGAIVGGIIGGLVVIAIVVVLVYFLVIRKRRQESEAYGGSNNKPADETIPYPSYPTNADVQYSKPNHRFQKQSERGVTNKGMDEPTRDEKAPSYEKNPDRYQNDRNFQRGGRNPGYDHGDERDTRNRRYSSDDGGTDRDVNTSMHSGHSVHSRGEGDPTMGTAI